MFSIAAKTGQRQLPAFETQTFTGQLEFTHNARIESVERVRATRGRKAVTQIGGPATPAELVLRFEQQNPFARFPKISSGGETTGVTANHDRVVGVIRTHLRRPALRSAARTRAAKMPDAHVPRTPAVVEGPAR